VSKKRRGCFSIVFKARDTLHSSNVAIKVFDPSPKNTADPYYLEAFKREPETLSRLLNKTRCLQLVAGYQTFNIEAKLGDFAFEVPVHYFATEWIEHEIDYFFERQDTLEARPKLVLFREILNAVEAFHSREVFHRDLKPDNLRARDPSGNNVVVVDFGAGARFDSDPLLKNYGRNVGAGCHSAPETLVGLSGHRAVAKFTDYFALGCMLYELFHFGYFQDRTLRNNDYMNALMILAAKLSNAPDSAQKYRVWVEEAPRLTRGIYLGPLFGRDSTAPRSLESLLERTVDGLTRFDFQERGKAMHSVRDWIDRAIRVLDSAKAQSKLVEESRRRRANRREKVRQTDLRFDREAAPRQGDKNA
jgi:serine/threonine protein kinase